METENEIYFKDVTQMWLAGKQAKLKRSTFYQYENVIHNHLDKTIGKVKLYEINNKIICNFFAGLIGQNSGILSNSTIKSVIYITKAVINYAVRSGMMEDPKIFFESPGKSQKREMVLSHQEEESLVNFLLNHRTLENTGILLAMFTGIRLGEMCALQWEDFDLEEKCMMIQKTVSRLPCDKGTRKTSLVIETPKSATSLRCIPIPEFLNEILKQKIMTHHLKEFLLSGSETKIPDPRTMQNKFRKCEELAEIAPYNFHILRHTFATRCVEMGFDIKSLSEVLGHASVNITLNRYVHSSMDMKKTQMLLLEQRWRGLNVDKILV